MPHIYFEQLRLFSSCHKVSEMKGMQNGNKILLRSTKVSCLCDISIFSFLLFSVTAPEAEGAPNVEPALSVSPTQVVAKQTPRKSTIGQRKPQSAKKGVSNP